MVGETAIFGTVDALGKAIGFLLLPITTFYLTPADFGVLGLFGTTSSILFIFCSLGLPIAFFRFYSEAKDDDARARTLHTALWSVTVYSAATLALVLLLGERLGEFLFKSSTANLALSGLVYLNCIGALGTCKLQADRKAWTFFWISVAGIIVHRGLGLYWIITGWGAWGWIYAEVLSAAFQFVLLFVTSFGLPRAQFSRAAAREMLPYGATLVPVVISSWIMAGCDKYMIRFLMANPFAEIGFYSFGERISSIMQMLTQAFGLGWRGFAFQNMHLEDGPRLLARGISLFIMTTGYAALGLSLLGDDLIYWTIDAEFAPGAVVIPALTLSCFFAGLGEVAGIGFHKARQTLDLAWYNVFAAVLNIALNFVTIPRYGILGAAWSTLISQAVKSAVIWYRAQLAFPIPLGYGHVSLAAAVYLGTYGVGRLLGGVAIERFPETQGWLVATVVETALVLGVPPLLWLTGAIRQEEKAMLRAGATLVLERIGLGSRLADPA